MCGQAELHSISCNAKEDLHTTFMDLEYEQGMVFSGPGPTRSMLK